MCSLPSGLISQKLHIYLYNQSRRFSKSNHNLTIAMDKSASDQEPLSHVKYWLTASDENDCFFNVGPESGPIERIGTFKVFLMAHSEPFRVMLGKGKLSEPGDILLPDITPETFKTFLKSIYLGNCEEVIEKLSFEDCCKLLYFVEKYIVTFLKCKLMEHMSKMLKETFNNIFTALNQPVCYQEQTLEKVVSEIVMMKTPEIISNDLFLEMSEGGLMFMVKQPYLSIREVLLWKAVVKWCENPIPTDKGEVFKNRDVIKFLQEMRFTDMTCEEFCTEVVSTGILEGNAIVDLCKSFQEKLHFTNSLTNNLYISCMSFSCKIINISKLQTSESESSLFFHSLSSMKFCLKLKTNTGGNGSLFLECKRIAKSRSSRFNENIPRRLLRRVDAEVILVGPRSRENQYIDFKGILGYDSTWSSNVCSINTLLTENQFARMDSVTIVVNIHLK